MQGVPDTFQHSDDRAAFRRPAVLPGAELYRARIVHHAFDPHTHDGYGVGVIDCGIERFRYRGREHEAAAGAVVLMQPGELHTGAPGCDEGWQYRMLYLDPTLIDTHLGEAHSPWYFQQAVRTEPGLAPSLSTGLQALWLATEAQDAEAQDVALAQILETLAPWAEGGEAPADARASRHAEPIRFARVCEAMRSDLAHTWRLAELAGLAAMSPSHFQRAFTACHHVSPHQWLMAQRLAEAKRLLSTGLPPSDAATSIGLTDQSHLTRRFAAMYGVTPARYQRDIGLRP